ncbi:MAG TPA: YcaO-like family protein [Pseudonocardiaceae bacterium]
MARKAFRIGTHRVRHPEQTWELIAPLLADYGVTRVADITGLDVLGVPVVMAVRPLGRTLAVSQGKGQTLLLAKLSAVMESMEFWHAEFHHPPLSYRELPASELDLPYGITQLAAGPDALVTDCTPLDWVDAVGLCGGGRVPVPARIVTLPEDQRSWVPPGLQWSSNGLAAGNSLAEATLHALYEVIERDAVSRRDLTAIQYVDPASITEPHCADLIARIAAGGATLRITHLPSRFAVPCFGATVWGPDFPVSCLGWGAHLDAGVAVSRAVTEAVQARLTAIAGSRDDLPPIYHQARTGTQEPRPAEGSPLSWADVESIGPGAFDDLAEELAWVSAKVVDVIGVEPVRVDLSTVEEFAVVKVLAPNTAFDREKVHPVR